MIPDDELIPLCKIFARKFARYAKHLGSRRDVLDELTNVGYVRGKELNNLKEANVAIIWELNRYVKLPQRDKVDQGRFRIADLRWQRSRRLEASAASIVEGKDELEMLRKFLLDLTPIQIDVIRLYYEKDKTFIEIGEIYGKSREWGRMLMKKTIEELRERMRSLK